MGIIKPKGVVHMLLNALPMGEEINYTPYILAAVALVVIVAVVALSFVKKK